MITVSWDAVDWPLALLLIYLLFPILAVTAIYLTGKPSEKKKNLKLVIGVITICISSALFMLAMLVYPAIGPWKVKDQGAFNRVEYTDTKVKKVPVGWYTLHKTIVHFTDGHTVVIPGEYSIEFPKGTPIKVITKNGFYKIERDQ